MFWAAAEDRAYPLLLYCYPHQAVCLIIYVHTIICQIAYNLFCVVWKNKLSEVCPLLTSWSSSSSQTLKLNTHHFLGLRVSIKHFGIDLFPRHSTWSSHGNLPIVWTGAVITPSTIELDAVELRVAVIRKSYANLQWSQNQGPRTYKLVSLIIVNRNCNTK